jgi:hypothetical protein
VYGSAPPSERPPGGFVVLPYRALRRLDPAGRSLAAGVARIPVEWLDTLVADRLPLVVEVTPGPSAALRRAGELRRATGLRVVGAAASGGGFAQSGRLLVLLLTLTIWTGAGVWLGQGMVALVVALTIGLPAAWITSIALHRWLDRGIRESWERGRVRQLGQRGGATTPTWDQVVDLRRKLADLDLPETAASDLRDALTDVERRLADLARTGGDAAALNEPLAEVAAALAPASTSSAEDADLARMERSVARLRAAAAGREGRG